jgi:hypothetical protein
MSALPLKADIGTQASDVRFVPKADIRPAIRSRPDSLIESFGFSFCFYEYREILAGLL